MSILDKLREYAVEVSALKTVVAVLRREADERPSEAVAHTALRVAVTDVLDAFDEEDTESFGECMDALRRALE